MAKKSKLTAGIVAGIVALTSIGYVTNGDCGRNENTLRLQEENWCLTDDELELAEDFLVHRIELSTNYDLVHAKALVDHSDNYRKRVESVIKAKEKINGEEDEDDAELKDHIAKKPKKKLTENTDLIDTMLP